MAVILNDTFYNDGQGIHTFAPVFNGLNILSHVSTLVMDDIFSNITGNAVEADGQEYGSESQYSLFFQVGAQVVGMSNPAVSGILGNPQFRQPDSRQLLPLCQPRRPSTSPEASRAVDLRRHDFPGRHD